MSAVLGDISLVPSAVLVRLLELTRPLQPPLVRAAATATDAAAAITCRICTEYLTGADPQ